MNLTKNGKHVLNEFSLNVIAGDIMGLMNVDNMGLSALLNLLLSGGPLDSGRMYFQGRDISAPLRRNRHNKISIVEGTSHLIHSLSIADNFFFIKERSPFFVQKKKQLGQLRMIFAKYGLELDGTEFPSDLTELERCKFELIKLSETGYKLIILKNISSFLNAAETEEVHALIKKISARKGVAFLYLSTHFSNFYSVCNVIAVMRSGSILYKKDTKSITPEMLGMSQKEFMNAFDLQNSKNPVQENVEIARIRKGRELDISVRKGECLVLLDLDNKIIGDICSALVDRKSEDMMIRVRGEDAFKNPSLYSYIPENPRETSFFPHMSYIDNLVMKKCLYGVKAFWLPAKFSASIKREYRDALGYMLEKQDLIDATQDELYNLLYQKVRIEHPAVVFINHPFDDLDMMQRVWCFDSIREIQNQGCTVVIFDIRPSELLRIADRVLIIQDGKITQTVTPENFEDFPFLK